jgi:ATP-dependent protease HslVU (ClpYQ) peptidase subunit
MTTILASKKHRVMVGDSYASGGGSGFSTIKVFNIGDRLVGFCGNLTHGLKFIEWLKHGTAITNVYDKEEHTFEALVMDSTGIHYYDNELISAEVMEDIYAIGSGAPYALGAIDAGASPKKAVEIAANRDDGSGHPIVVLRLKGD